MASNDRIRKVEALVISHRDFGEADRILKLFTREEGKLNAIAKGARRMRSRKAAHLEPFTHSALVLAVGRNLWIVTQADTISSFPNIHADVQKTGQASYVLELADFVSTEFQPDRAMYRLVLETLQRIERTTDTFNLLLHFELRLLDHAGFKPELFRCTECGTQIEAEDQHFSTVKGGVLCPRCQPKGYEKSIPADVESLRFMRHFQRNSFNKVALVEIPEKPRKPLRHVMDAYISAVTERRLNSPAFIDRVNHLNSRKTDQTDLE
jgi:DNA repair protein RecO (recombination protein O)